MKDFAYPAGTRFGNLVSKVDIEFDLYPRRRGYTLYGRGACFPIHVHSGEDGFSTIVCELAKAWDEFVLGNMSVMPSGSFVLRRKMLESFEVAS